MKYRTIVTPCPRCIDGRLLVKGLGPRAMLLRCLLCGETLFGVPTARRDALEADRLASLREANPRRGRPGGTGRGR